VFGISILILGERVYRGNMISVFQHYREIREVQVSGGRLKRTRGVGSVEPIKSSL